MLMDIVAKTDDLLEITYHCLLHARYIVMGIDVFSAFEAEIHSEYALYVYPREDMLLHPVKPQYKGLDIVITPEDGTLELGFWTRDDADKMRQYMEKLIQRDQVPWIKWFLDIQSLRDGNK